MFEKIWSNIKGEAKLVFGMSDTGQIRVNEKGQLEFDTCFVAGTLIRTKEGYTAIDKLKVGDYVLSHNEKTGILSYNKITETFIHDVPAIYKITYTNGTEVETTWNHPFYIKGQGWTKAKFLNPEQRSVTVSSIRNAAILREMSDRSQMSISLAALNNRAAVTPWNELYEGTAGIAKIERVIRPEKVYNIEVEGDHSYFVTKAGLLVHNYLVDTKRDALIPEKDIRGLTTANNSEKYKKLVINSESYNRVVDKAGNVSYEGKNAKGEVVKITVTSAGYLEKTTIHPEKKLFGLIKIAEKSEVEYLKPNLEKVTKEQAFAVRSQVLTVMENGVAKFTSEFGSNGHLNQAEKEAIHKLGQELQTAKDSNKAAITDKILQIRTEAYIRENDLAFLTPKEQETFKENIKKVQSNEKGAEVAGKAILDVLSKHKDGTLQTYEITSKSKDVPQKDLETLTKAKENPRYKKLILDGNTYDLAISKDGKVTYERRRWDLAKEVVEINAKGSPEITIIGGPQLVSGRQETTITFDRNGNRKENTPLQSEIAILKREIISDENLNGTERGKIKELSLKLETAKTPKEIAELKDSILTIKAEAYIRENKLFNNTSPEEKASAVAALKKIALGDKGADQAAKDLSQTLQKLAGGPQSEFFPNKGVVGKLFGDLMNKAENAMTRSILNRADSERKSNAEYAFTSTKNKKGEEVFSFDIKNPMKEPKFMGFEEASKLLDFNDSNQFSTNDYNLIKEGKGGLLGQLDGVIRAVHDDIKNAKYFYQERYDAVLKDKQNLEASKKGLSDISGEINTNIKALKTEIATLEKMKKPDETTLAKIKDLKTQSGEANKRLEGVNKQIKDLNTEIRRADAEIAYHKDRSETFETSKKWFAEKAHAYDATKGVTGGICYGWSDYALLRLNNLEKRPFGVWYREQMLKGNLKLDTTQAGAVGVFTGTHEDQGDGLFGGHEAAYIHNNTDPENRKGIWQEMPYEQTIQKLKDEGVQAFKVWIDKKEAAKANWDLSGQHYFLVIWNDAKGAYVMMDHNNNDQKEYHNKLLNPEDFSKFRKITYFKPKTR